MPRYNMIFDDEGDVLEDQPRAGKVIPKVKKPAYIERRLAQKYDIRPRRVDTDLLIQ